jgi:hypothetical protein
MFLILLALDLCFSHFLSIHSSIFPPKNWMFRHRFLIAWGCLVSRLFSKKTIIFPIQMSSCLPFEFDEIISTQHFSFWFPIFPLLFNCTVHYFVLSSTLKSLYLRFSQVFIYQIYFLFLDRQLPTLIHILSHFYFC